MLFLFSVVTLVFPVLILIVLDRMIPGSKFRWLITFSGVIPSLICTFLWQINFPDRIFLPAWQPISLYQYRPGFLLDSVSWPYSVSLVSLAGAIILTSGMRGERSSRSWIFTLLYTALGVLSVSAADPLTLALVWTAMDLLVLIFGLFFTQGQENGLASITAFALKVMGTGILLFSCVIGSAGFLPLSYERIPSTLLVLLVSGLRVGILPMQLKYTDEATTRRGLYTCFRLVSAAAGFSFLGRIPLQSYPSTWNLVVFILLALLSIWAGWMWFSSSAEIHARPYWIVGLASLLAASSLVSSPVVGVSWGVTLVLCGGLLFLFSSRERNILWLPLFSLVGLAALPFSLNAGVWVPSSGSSWIPILFILPSQSLLVAGFLHQLLKPGERLDKSGERWIRILYLSGLSLLLGIIILLGFWDWSGASRIGAWWASIIVILLSTVFFYIGSRRKVTTRLDFIPWNNAATRAALENLGKFMVTLAERFLLLLSSTLEGEGGIIWSILILVLILSLVALGGR